jgi:outer membrane protein OmpA-like peptidoglycan-associated protein
VLQDFFPRYLTRLEEFRDDLAEVRIEGHTSAEWRGAATPLDAYFRNMELSQGRTRAVLDFGLRETEVHPGMRDWARGLITANGLSSSHLRLRADGTEDREGSRRVEFRAVMKLRERLMRVVPGE